MFNASSTWNETSSSHVEFATAIETVWYAHSIVLVFSMQIGFALLESGSVRRLNSKSVLLKNFIDVPISILVWLSFGSYIAGNQLGYGDPEENSMESVRLLFGLMFACSTATIISGATTERISIFAYIIITAFTTGLIYPVVVRLVWKKGGWLYELGYVDFAGSSVVHAVGGAIGIISAWRLGPRRFGVPVAGALLVMDTALSAAEEAPSSPDAVSVQPSMYSTRSGRKKQTKAGKRQRRSSKDSSDNSSSSSKQQKRALTHLLEERLKFIERSQFGTPGNLYPVTRFFRFERPDLDAKEFKGNSPAFAVIGTLMLWWGFYGFNAGSANILGDGSAVVMRVMWNTTMGAAGGQCAAILICFRATIKPHLKIRFVMHTDIMITICNATLAGLASICAGSDKESTYSSFIIGMAGALLSSCISGALKCCGIDDPLDAGAVHVGGGVAGSLLCGLFPQQPMLGHEKAPSTRDPRFWIQCLGVVTIVSWAALASLIVVEFLKHMNLLRVSQSVEDDGFDVWLQQSTLPPSAPDVLKQLPNFETKAKTKQKRIWSVDSRPPIPTVASSSFKGDTNERKPLRDSISRHVQKLTELESGVRSPEQKAFAQDGRSFSDENAWCQGSLEEQFEKELELMLTFSQDGDADGADCGDMHSDSSHWSNV
eukprot:gnl/MRDRNA2_/MRDRNA2_86471_c2_seq1.p1 gnl/MRDRNA2_/MRDRNA2_86471_c2~~gnl/MRDRNA2_/MRDRNA2_86471_c2_seq1.p1  ORF type:complete len:657 (-),score=105.88 gnl/MRDRNA2_/MRDRNA2_86471_c2_seq1:205-2175(-)